MDERAPSLSPRETPIGKPSRLLAQLDRARGRCRNDNMLHFLCIMKIGVRGHDKQHLLCTSGSQSSPGRPPSSLLTTPSLRTASPSAHALDLLVELHVYPSFIIGGIAIDADAECVRDWVDSFDSRLTPLILLIRSSPSPPYIPPTIIPAIPSPFHSIQFLSILRTP